MLHQMALVFRDMLRDVALVSRYGAGELVAADESPWRCTADERRALLHFFVHTACTMRYCESPVLMLRGVPAESLSPGEYRGFYCRNPNAFGSVLTVLHGRGRLVNAIIEQSQELPHAVIARHLGGGAASGPNPDRAGPNPAPQSVQLRLALQAQLTLYMDTHYAEMQFGERVLVPYYAYADSLARLESAVNQPMLVQLFNHWQLHLNGQMHMFNSLVEAFGAWLKVVRHTHGGRVCLDRVDLRPLLAAALPPDATAPPPTVARAIKRAAPAPLARPRH
jgi:hypothetical protein